MAVICDECDDEISLHEAEEFNGRILFPECLDDEEEEDDEEDEKPAPRRNCQKCWKSTRVADLSEKLEWAQGICPKCAHAYELKVWTPPDHDPAECKLCTAH